MAQGINIDVRSNLSALAPRLDQFQKSQLPFVTAYALTKTAQDIQRAEYDVMRQVFDRPTAFTLNSLYVKPATKRLPIASVEFKEGFGSVPAWRYLGPEVEGGPRVKKSHERALERAGILKAGEFCVPGQGVQLDQSGNMRGSDITRILSQLQASPDNRQNATNSRRSRRKRQAHGIYFVMRGRGIPDGVYRRQGTRNIVPILIFVRQPRYKAIFPFHDTAQRTFDNQFDRRFDEGMARYAPYTPIPAAA